MRKSTPSTTDAWERRLRYGQVAMSGSVYALGGKERGLAAYADYSDRIEKGELPPVPPRPRGIERNVVVTLWDVSTPTAFVHDVVATDKRNPTMNGYGKIYGVEFHNNALVELDPVKNTTRLLPIPTRDDRRLMVPFTRQQVVHGELLNWPTIRRFSGFDSMPGCAMSSSYWFI